MQVKISTPHDQLTADLTRLSELLTQHAESAGRMKSALSAYPPMQTFFELDEDNTYQLVALVDQLLEEYR